VPAQQRGSVDKPGPSWRARWSDENGKRRGRRGFRTKTAARSWLRVEVDSVRERRLYRQVAHDPPVPPVPPRRRKFVERDLAETDMSLPPFPTEQRAAQAGEWSYVPNELMVGYSGPLMTAREVAARLGLSTRWVYEQSLAYERGDPLGLPAYRLGNGKRRSVRFARRDIDEWLQQRRTLTDGQRMLVGPDANVPASLASPSCPPVGGGAERPPAGQVMQAASTA